jgi:hypothetical protein
MARGGQKRTGGRFFLRGQLTTDRWDLVKVDRGVRALVAGLFLRRPGAEL